MKMRFLLMSIMLTGCTGTQGDLVLSAGSKHSRETAASGREYNEFNPGGGMHITTTDWLGKGQGWRKGLIGFTYRNSFEKQSVLAGGSYEYCYSGNVRVCGGAMAGAVTGYGGIKPFVAPTAEIGNGRVSLVGTMFPADKFRALVGVIMLKIKLAEW